MTDSPLTITVTFPRRLEHWRVKIKGFRDLYRIYRNGTWFADISYWTTDPEQFIRLHATEDYIIEFR